MKWFYIFISIILFIYALLFFWKFFEPRYVLPKIIWFYWDKEMPLLIQQIKDYNRQALEGWDVRYLNEHTLGEYIKPWDFPSGYDKLISQHKADWIRAFLLMNHGGCWCDASIILNSGNSVNDLWEESVDIRSDFTGFYTDHLLENKHFKGIPVNIENWFFMVPQESRILRLWYDEFTKAITEGFPNYASSIIKEKGVNVIDYGAEVYFTQHKCLQVVLQRIKKLPPMILKPSRETMFKLHSICEENKSQKVVDSDNDWKRKCIMNSFKEQPEENRKIPFIKLSRFERETEIDISPFFKM